MERRRKWPLRLKGLLLKRWFWYGAVAAVLIAVGVLGIKRLTGTKSINESAKDGRVTVKEARASQEVNREFSFPLRNGKGEEVSRIKITIEKAEIRDEIIVKGKKATSVKGRTFLVLNLRVRNEYGRAIEVDSRDYVRLAVNGSEEDWLAPEVHNDPVEVQAISTKYTRVGFAINESDKEFMLQIGEIREEKEKVKLDLKI